MGNLATHRANDKLETADALLRGREVLQAATNNNANHGQANVTPVFSLLQRPALHFSPNDGAPWAHSSTPPLQLRVQKVPVHLREAQRAEAARPPYLTCHKQM